MLFPISVNSLATLDPMSRNMGEQYLCREYQLAMHAYYSMCWKAGLAVLTLSHNCADGQQQLPETISLDNCTNLNHEPDFA